MTRRRSMGRCGCGGQPAPVPVSQEEAQELVGAGK